MSRLKDPSRGRSQRRLGGGKASVSLVVLFVSTLGTLAFPSASSAAIRPADIQLSAHVAQRAATVSGNSAPSIWAPDSVAGLEGQTVAISATATDPDQGQSVTINASGGPASLTLTGGASGSVPKSAVLAGMLDFASAGEWVITWTAVDNSAEAATATGTTALTVENVDRPPLVDAPSEIAGTATVPIEFAVTASDPDGDQIGTLMAGGLPPGAAFTPGPSGAQASFRWVPDPEQTGAFDIDLAASSSGATSHATVTVSVSPSGAPRRARVDPALLDLQPGLLRSERILSRDETGRTFVDLFVVGDASTQSLEGLGVKVNTRVGRMMTAQCPLDALSALMDAPDLDALLAPGSCKLLLDSSTVNVEVAGIRTLPGDRPLVGRTGAGVVVGTVDTGIDVHHPDFLRVAGTTRLLGYWNQWRNDAPPPPGFLYGVEWTPTEINSGQTDVWAEDSVGHGTHVMGIAAGNGDASDAPCLIGSGRYAYVGIAPEAELVAVKTVPSGSFVKVSALENRVVDAINYVFTKAAPPPPDLPKPAVVNVSLGSHRSPHDGRGTLDWFTNQLTGPGKIVVAAAGNDANTGAHAKADVRVGSPSEATLDVGIYSPGSISGKYIRLVGWHKVADRVGVTVITPGPEPSVVGPVYDSTDVSAETPKGKIRIVHKQDAIGAPCHLPPLGACTWAPDVPFLIEITDGGASPISSGTWTVEFAATRVDSGGRVDTYLTEADLGPDTPLIQFVIGADSSRTVTSPATADSVISVGAYSTRECWTHVNGQVFCQSFSDALGDILHFSSRGPRRDGVTKPDLCAPGAMVVASKSFSSFLTPSPDTTQVVTGGKYVAQAGTSMAAPHVTGAVALMLGRLETSPPESVWSNATPSKIRSRLQASAKKDAFTGSQATNRWGAGKLDVRAALAPVMGLRFTEPRKGAIFTNHWGQASILGDSATPTFVFDSVVVHLAPDGCSYTERVWKLTNVQLAKKSYSFLYYYAGQPTTTAKLRAVGYKGPNKVYAISDSVFAFSLEPQTAVDNAPAWRFALYPNAPNPFNPTTSIRFEIAKRGQASVRLFGVNGRLVRTLVDQELAPGPYSVLWDGSNDHAAQVGSGIYFCEVMSNGESLRRKITLIR